MNHVKILIIISVVFIISACGQKNYEPDPFLNQKEVSVRDELDPELTEPWPDLKGAVVLTEKEKQALESKLDIEYELTEHAHRRIQSQFIYLARKRRSTVEKWLKRAETYLPYTMKIFQERGLPRDLAFLPFIESGFNPKAYSRAGAAGLWQFMPYTGRKFGLRSDWWIDERYDAYKATHAAADYLSMLHSMFDDWTLALASYNCGEGKISKGVQATGSKDFFGISHKNHTLNKKARLRTETLDYVPRFIAMVKIANNLKLLGFKSINMNNAPELEKVRVKPGTDLKALARSCGMSWNSFYAHNQAFRRYASPPDTHSQIYIPSVKVAAAKEFLKKPAATPYAGYHVHIVKKGDSWSRIGHNYGVPVSVLKKVNRQKSNLLKLGQKVMVPKGRSSSKLASTSSRKTKSARTADAKSKDLTNAKTRTVNKSNYKVKRGDTLYSLARQNDISVKTLLKANGLKSPKALKAGQNIVIPGANPAEKSKSSTQIKIAALDKNDSRAGGRKAAVPKPSLAGATPRKALTPAKFAGEPSEVYLVKRGDTVWSIARKFSVSPIDLLEWNNLTRKCVLKPGDKITVLND